MLAFWSQLRRGYASEASNQNGFHPQFLPHNLATWEPISKHASNWNSINFSRLPKFQGTFWNQGQILASSTQLHTNASNCEQQLSVKLLRSEDSARFLVQEDPIWLYHRHITSSECPLWHIWPSLQAVVSLSNRPAGTFCQQAHHNTFARRRRDLQIWPPKPWQLNLCQTYWQRILRSPFRATQYRDLPRERPSWLWDHQKCPSFWAR